MGPGKSFLLLRLLQLEVLLMTRFVNYPGQRFLKPGGGRDSFGEEVSESAQYVEMGVEDCAIGGFEHHIGKIGVVEEASHAVSYWEDFYMRSGEQAYPEMQLWISAAGSIILGRVEVALSFATRFLKS